MPGWCTSSAGPSSPMPARPPAPSSSTSTRCPGQPEPSRSSASRRRTCRRWCPARVLRRDLGFRCRRSSHRAGRRPAGRACSPRGACSPDRPSAPTARAPSCWPTSGPSEPVRSRAPDLGRVADQRGTTTYCLDGQVYTVGVGGALAGRPGGARGRRRPRPAGRDGARRRGGHLRAVPRRARCPLVGAGGAGVLTGLGSDTTGGHVVRAVCEGIAAQIADLAATMAADLGCTADVVERRRRADPVDPAHADPGRPSAAAGRGLRLSRRHGPRGSGVRQPRARPVTDARRRGGAERARPRRTSRGSARTRLRNDCTGTAGRSLASSPRNRPSPDDRAREPDLRRGRRRRRRGRVRGRSRAGPLAVAGGVARGGDDVGDGTSKANTAILHTGFDATPGTLESRLVARGFDLLSAYAARSGIPVEPVGALLVAWDPEQLAALPGLAEKAASERVPEDAARRGRRALRAPSRTSAPAPSAPSRSRTSR